MAIFERETVKRKPVSFFKILAIIFMTVALTNLCIAAFRTLSPVMNSLLSLLVLIGGMTLVWRLVARNGETLTYKLVDDVFVVERTLGRSNSTFFSVKFEKIIAVRAYDHNLDRNLPSKKRFVVSSDKSLWRVVVYQNSESSQLIIEPSEHFEQCMITVTQADQVNQ